MAGASRTTLLGTLKQLHDTGAFSDLVLTCGPDTYKLHKAIVCSRAGFFDRAVRFGGNEAEEGKIDLPEDEPAIIKLVIAYIYEGEYEPTLVTILQLSRSEEPAMRKRGQYVPPNLRGK